MQSSLSNLISQPKKWPISIKNKYLKEIFDKFVSCFYLDVNKFINEITQYNGESTIIVIEKYSETNDSEYIFACFDYKFIIIQIKAESDTLIL